MLKIRYIPTGDVYILPDEEVIRIKNSDIDGRYEILTDLSGKQEELNDEVPNEAVQQPVKPSLKHVNEAEYLAMDLDLENASAVELRGYCGRLGIKVKAQESKKSMIAKLKETGLIE